MGWLEPKGLELHFFFFQAEDGIRDYKVTGVQTCALPISGQLGAVGGEHAHGLARPERAVDGDDALGQEAPALLDQRAAGAVVDDELAGRLEIGRGAWRGRV